MKMKLKKITRGVSHRDYFTQVPNYVIDHSTLYDLAVYLHIKRIAGEDGICWASQKNLARKGGMSLNRLKKSLKSLLFKGWVEEAGKKRVSTPGGPQEIQQYRPIDIWIINKKHYQSLYKGVSPNDTPLEHGGITNKAKGVSPQVPNKIPYKEEPSLVETSSTERVPLKRENTDAGANANTGERNTTNDKDTNNEFSFNWELMELWGSNHPTHRAVYCYFQTVEKARGSYEFDNREAFDLFLGPSLKAAAKLTKAYPLEKIELAILRASEKWPDEFTLNTVVKRIADLV